MSSQHRDEEIQQDNSDPKVFFENERKVNESGIYISGIFLLATALSVLAISFFFSLWLLLPAGLGIVVSAGTLWVVGKYGYMLRKYDVGIIAGCAVGSFVQFVLFGYALLSFITYENYSLKTDFKGVELLLPTSKYLFIVPSQVKTLFSQDVAQNTALDNNWQGFSNNPFDYFQCVVNKKTPLFSGLTAWTERSHSESANMPLLVNVKAYDTGRHGTAIIRLPGGSSELVIAYVPVLDFSRETGFDYKSIVTKTGGLFTDSVYKDEYTQRLLPVFVAFNEIMRRKTNKVKSSKPLRALVTIPGLGLGNLSGGYQDYLPKLFCTMVCDLLSTHSSKLDHLDFWLSFYNPKYVASDLHTFGNSKLYIDLSENSRMDHMQPLKDYEDFLSKEHKCDRQYDQLFTIGSWNPYTWPGDEWIKGNRSGDGAVKCAATSTLEILSGIPGSYCENVGTPGFYPANGKLWSTLLVGSVQKLNPSALSIHCSRTLKDCKIEPFD